MGKFSFSKEERLNQKKLIQELFTKGSSFYSFPFKILVLSNPNGEYPVHQTLISVSKRGFKKAVDRNLIKRRIRESYRLQKHLLQESPKLILGFVYTHKEVLTFQELQKKMCQILPKITKLLPTFSKLS